MIRMRGNGLRARIHDQTQFFRSTHISESSQLHVENSSHSISGNNSDKETYFATEVLPQKSHLTVNEKGPDNLTRLRGGKEFSRRLHFLSIPIGGRIPALNLPGPGTESREATSNLNAISLRAGFCSSFSFYNSFLSVEAVHTFLLSWF